MSRSGPPSMPSKLRLGLARSSSSGTGGFSKPSRVPSTERNFRMRKTATPARTRSCSREEFMDGLKTCPGAWLVRWQGMGVLRDLQRAQDEMRDPFSPLAHGALILLGGMLLILPGFFTDSLGLLLMIPPLRRGLIRYAASRIRFERFAAAGCARQRAPADDWVDAEFEEIVPERDKLGGPSKWTRH